AATRKVRRSRMIRTWHGAICDAIAVDVFVASKASKALKIFFAENLAAFKRFLRIRKWIRHPVVHAEVKIRHDKHRSLKLFSKVECILRHREALEWRCGKQKDMLGIAMAEHRGEKNVALRCSRRQTSGRPDALDIPNHRGDFDVISKAGKLRHQRDTRASGRSHGARSSPCCADDHTDRRQLVFSLYDGKCCLAIRSDAMFFHVFDESFYQRRRWRYRIPSHHGASGEHAAKSGGRVAVDDDLSLIFVHPPDRKRIALGQ